MKTWHVAGAAISCFVLISTAASIVHSFPPMALVLASVAGVGIGHLTARRRFDAEVHDLGLRVKQEKARVVDLKSRRVLYVDPVDDKDKPLFG
ncbi:hypothetical protein [Pleomorphomonas sp. PLEO]|uniref:hypothetical protein n=1 Tax=Pleomorphomonas sp. PLEO TaxID=3239306 RepID=UPI00351DC5B8